MSDEHKKPDPIEDVRKGLGLLFRAARTAVDEIPTDKLEGAVRTGAREVTRVIETVTHTIEKEILHHTPKSTPPAEPPTAKAPENQPPENQASAEARSEAKSEAKAGEATTPEAKPTDGAPEHKSN